MEYIDSIPWLFCITMVFPRLSAAGNIINRTKVIIKAIQFFIVIPVIRAINTAGSSGTFVVSADINSGLNGDTGEGTLFVKSDLTVSIGEFKYGHFIGQADEAMKDKVNVDIGIQIIGETDEI